MYPWRLITLSSCMAGAELQTTADCTRRASRSTLSRNLSVAFLLHFQTVHRCSQSSSIASLMYTLFQSLSECFLQRRWQSPSPSGTAYELVIIATDPM